MSSGPESDGVFSWRSVFGMVSLIAVGVPLLWLAFNADMPAPAELREIIAGYGWAGWLVFIGLAAAIAITPIPITVPALVAGSLYGVVGGTLLSFTGVMLGSWIGYWLARGVGKRTVMLLLGQHGPVVEKYLDNAGFWAMCTVRLLPGLPYWPVNYGAGALGVGHHAFVSATFIASIPGQVSLVSLGAFAASPSVVHGVVLVCSWLVVLGLTWVSYRRWRGTQPAARESAREEISASQTEDSADTADTADTAAATKTDDGGEATGGATAAP